MRIVLPTAPRRHVTLHKMQMNSWYDIFENESAMDRVAMLKEGKFDEVQRDIWKRYNQEDIVKSSEVLIELIEEERKLFKDGSASKILIGGMSQGCEVALATLLRYKGPEPLGGVIGLSGILGFDFENQSGQITSMAQGTALPASQADIIRRTPLFLYQGEDDSNCQISVVEFSLRKIKEIHTKEGGKVDRNYSFQTEAGMGHYMSDQELKLLRKWIKKTMARQLSREPSFSQCEQTMLIDDDMLMGAKMQNETTEKLKTLQPQHLLYNMIVPLKFEDLVSDHFRSVLENTKNDVMLNIFIVGYECDQGVRACGGRSGTELGPTVFRKLLQEENQHAFDDLAKQLKKHQVVIYDLGNVRKY